MKCQQTKQYFVSAALLPRTFAALALGGARVEFRNALSAKSEIWGAPEHRERLQEGQPVLLPLLPRGPSSSSAAVPAGALSPARMGSWQTACCKVLRGKQISLRHSESQSCHGALKNKAWGKQSNTPVSTQSVGWLPPAFPTGSGIPPISYPSSALAPSVAGDSPCARRMASGRKGLAWLSRAGDWGTALVLDHQPLVCALY